MPGSLARQTENLVRYVYAVRSLGSMHHTRLARGTRMIDCSAVMSNQSSL